MLLCMDWGVDVALRLSYQTPLLLSTFMKSQEVGVGQKRWGRRVMGWENRFLCSQIFAVIYLVGLGLNRTPGQIHDLMTSRVFSF